MTITNSTISGNRATGSGGDNGGGLRLGSATIENSTITNKFAVGPSRAGGLRINVGTVTLRNSIIAANTASTPDVSSTSGSLSSGGFNLIGNPGPLNVNGTNDQKGTPAAPLDPLLLPLADNGGGTPTHAPRAASPALDQGSRFGAIADQRGTTRPFDVGSIAGPGDQSDIGAVELHGGIVTNANNDGAGSLRQVITDAAANGDILFDPAFFNVPRTIALDGEIVVDKSLTIQGPGANLLTLSGRNLNRVFQVVAGKLHVAIAGVTLSAGFAGNPGGVILSASDLTLSRCAVVGGRAVVGGGVLVGGKVVATFADTTFSGNAASLRGGAVELRIASGSFTNCTLSGNRGGGISLFSTGDQTVTVTNSTIADSTGANTSGIRIEASAAAASSLTVRSSILANNTGASLVKAATGGPTTITSLGYNLSNDDGGGFLTQDTDQTGTDPKLSPLQYNGGPTQTHMPLPDSPALDQGNSAGIIVDQRGRTRSFDVDGIPAIPGGDNSDIGAVEAHPAIVTNNDNAGTGSLRAVVGSVFPGDDVWFDPTFFAQRRIIFLQSEVLIGETLTIHGPAARLTVSGSALGRVFNIASGIEVAINDLDMLDGKSAENGGVIASNADLMLTRCAIANGETTMRGAGVYLHDAVGTFIDSLISGNRSGSRGGGIGLDEASAILTNCTVSGNTAPSFGGVIAVTTGPVQTLTVTNSTITANAALVSGAGGIRVEGAVPTTLRNSIVADNTDDSLEGSTFTSLGYNLLGNVGAVLGPEDRILNDVKLGPLPDNGGPTLTHALLPGSPAIDRGAAPGFFTDQRGFPRPLDDGAITNAIGGDGSDIGAFELSLPPPTPTATPTITPTRTPTATIGSPTATRTRTPTLGVGVPTPTHTRTPTTGPGIPTATRTATSGGPTPTRTATGNSNPTATATATGSSPTPTATATGGPPACFGDCNGDHTVRVDELVVGVGIALDRRPIDDCRALDRDGNGAADVAELVAAVNNALNDCPVSQP